VISRSIRVASKSPKGNIPKRLCRLFREFDATLFGPSYNLPQASFFRIMKAMEVHFTPDLQAKIDQLVIETGRAPDKLLEDAMAGYVAELVQTREMLNSRYDDLKSGRVKPIPGDEVVARLREKSAARRAPGLPVHH